MKHYKFDLEIEDIGGIIKMIRVNHLSIKVEELATELKLNEKTIKEAESGKGAHGITILKKITKRYPSVEVKMECKF